MKNRTKSFTSYKIESWSQDKYITLQSQIVENPRYAEIHCYSSN